MGEWTKAWRGHAEEKQTDAQPVMGRRSGGSTIFCPRVVEEVFCNQTTRPSSASASQPEHMEGKSPRNNASKIGSRSRRESSTPQYHPGRRQPVCDQHVFESIKLRDDFARPGSGTDDYGQNPDRSIVKTPVQTNQAPVRGRAFARQRFRIGTGVCRHQAINQTVVAVLQAAHRRQSRIVFN